MTRLKRNQFIVKPIGFRDRANRFFERQETRLRFEGLFENRNWVIETSFLHANPSVKRYLSPIDTFD